MTEDRIRDAIQSLAAGRGVVVVDDADRENEGDVIFAASTVTEEQIAFLMRTCRGLICVAMTGDALDRLDLPLMTVRNEESRQTAFTVSVDAREGITTGISAADRALTARLLADERTSPEALVRPGHLFPLRAVPGGVLERPGHTEAAVDLAQLAGVGMAGVICEVADDAGRMLRGDALRTFADAHELPLISIATLAAFLGGR